MFDALQETTRPDSPQSCSSGVILKSVCLLQLLAVFMQLDTRSLLMNYIDLRRTNDVQLTFDALLVRLKSIVDIEGNQLQLCRLFLSIYVQISPITGLKFLMAECTLNTTRNIICQ